ncbi:MAG: hypothetical protein JJ896_11795 [Rhodothermales bacterium]|nr:hypothetical protein [Rhodothermales bacterium]MBO6780327.1 hypothetical protein [Rhodothermales bacterium]
MTDTRVSPLTPSAAVALGMVFMAALAVSFRHGAFISPPVVLGVGLALLWIFRPRSVEAAKR